MNGNDDTHQRTEGTQGYGPCDYAGCRSSCQGAYAGSAARCDVRAAAGASCARCEKGQDSDRVRTHAVPHAQEQPDEAKEVSLREAIGHVLRDLRTRDHKTLREVSEKAGVSLGYLSEVERGQKEASSELLSSIAQSLGLSTAQMLRMVADYLDSVAA